jgi:hypothetical protein
MFHSYKKSTLSAMGISEMPEQEFRSPHPGHITNRQYKSQEQPAYSVPLFKSESEQTKHWLIGMPEDVERKRTLDYIQQAKARVNSDSFQASSCMQRIKIAKASFFDETVCDKTFNDFTTVTLKARNMLGKVDTLHLPIKGTPHAVGTSSHTYGFSTNGFSNHNRNKVMSCVTQVEGNYYLLSTNHNDYSFPVFLNTYGAFVLPTIHDTDFAKFSPEQKDDHPKDDDRSPAKGSGHSGQQRRGPSSTSSRDSKGSSTQSAKGSKYHGHHKRSSGYDEFESDTDGSDSEDSTGSQKASSCVQEDISPCSSDSGTSTDACSSSGSSKTSTDYDSEYDMLRHPSLTREQVIKKIDNLQEKQRKRAKRRNEREAKQRSDSEELSDLSDADMGDLITRLKKLRQIERNRKKHKDQKRRRDTQRRNSPHGLNFALDRHGRKQITRTRLTGARYYDAIIERAQCKDDNTAVKVKDDALWLSSQGQLVRIKLMQAKRCKFLYQVYAPVHIFDDNGHVHRFSSGRNLLSRTEEGSTQIKSKFLEETYQAYKQGVKKQRSVSSSDSEMVTDSEAERLIGDESSEHSDASHDQPSTDAAAPQGTSASPKTTILEQQRLEMIEALNNRQSLRLITLHQYPVLEKKERKARMNPRGDRYNAFRNRETGVKSTIGDEDFKFERIFDPKYAGQARYLHKETVKARDTTQKVVIDLVCSMKNSESDPLTTYLAAVRKLFELQHDELQFQLFYNHLMETVRLIQVKSEEEMQSALHYLEIMALAHQHVLAMGLLMSHDVSNYEEASQALIATLLLYADKCEDVINKVLSRKQDMFMSGDRYSKSFEQVFAKLEAVNENICENMRNKTQYLTEKLQEHDNSTLGYAINMLAKGTVSHFTSYARVCAFDVCVCACMRI